MISYIEAIPAFSDNYIWVLRKNDSVVVVDPGDPEAVESYLEKKNLKLEAILITHHHYDHTGGIMKLNEKWNPEVYGPKGGHIQGIKRELSEKSIIKILDTEFVIFETPGHTLDHIAYYSKDINSLFCGDTLFSAGCGRVFEGTFEQMHNSIQKLNQLNPETIIYCAHEYTESNLKFVNSVMTDDFIKQYTLDITQKIQDGFISLPTKLKLERKINPFLLNKTPADLEGLSPLDQFTELRTRKDDS